MKRKRQITKPRRRDFLSKKKVCRLCSDKVKSVDYKDIPQLQKFITERGKIIPPRLSGTCTRHQRTIDLAIKRARSIALLPFINK